MPMLTVDKAAQASEFTEESFWQHGSEVNRRFTERWRELMPEEKPVPNMQDFLEFMARDLKASREASVATAQDHEIQLGGDSGLRVEREEAFTEAASVYVDTRSIVESIYGREGARKLGFSFPRSENSYRFRRQMAMVLRAFRALPQDEPVPAPAGKEALAVLPSYVVDALEPRYERLKTVLKAILTETRRAQKSQTAKQEAYETQVKRYSMHAKCGEMIYRMVGLEKFADQIKPSTRRPGQREVDVEGTEDDAPASPPDSDSVDGQAAP